MLTYGLFETLMVECIGYQLIPWTEKILKRDFKVKIELFLLKINENFIKISFF
jgi:hypothetical protein